MPPSHIPKKAATIDELRRTCKPMPLIGDALKTFYVETDNARDPNQDTRDRLKKSLEQEPSRVLFYGHRGCGKSTELNKFLEENKRVWFPVKFSVLDEMTPSNALAEDLVLVITSKIVEVASEAGINADERLLEGVYNYFASETKTAINSNAQKVGAKGGMNTKGSYLQRLLAVMVDVSAEIRLNSYSETTIVHTLRKCAGDLPIQANRVIKAIAKDLKAQGKRLLVVVEDIDKLDLKQAHEMFVRNTNLLTTLDADIIYTIPIYLIHSPDLGAFKPHFDDVIGLPMIKISNPHRAHKEGRAIIETIINARVEKDLIQKDAMKLLIEKTGGVLRHVFEVLNTVSTMANITAPVSKNAIRYGLDQLRKTCWQQIALPVDNRTGIQSVDELYARLQEYAAKQQQGIKPLPKPDPINQLLLKTCALIEYNGDGWFGVHPLVVENLKRLGHLSK